MAGRPKHVPTEAQKRQVESLASFGTSQERIAKLIGVSEPTLRKCYRAVLDVAEDKANAMVVDSMFRMAVGRPAEYDAQGHKIRSEILPQVSAAAFWIARRLRWTEAPVPTDEGQNELVVRIVRGGLPERSRAGTGS